MHVLVTGANSFLGRHVTRHLFEQGFAVTGTYRSEGAATVKLRAIAGDADLVRIDLAAWEHFARLPARIDGIVHIAGVSTADNVSVDAMLACNVAGGRNLLRYALAAKASRLVYASTLSVHGRISAGVVDEDTPIRDPDVYGASKFLAERIFAAYAAELPGAAVRLPGVLGLGAHRAWIPTVLQSLRQGSDVAIYNPRSPFNNAAHVDDLVLLFTAILHSTSPGFLAFPVGADGFMTVEDLVGRMVELTGSKSRVTAHAERRPSFTISSDFAMTNFGYRPQSIGEMIERYCLEETEKGELFGAAVRAEE